MDVTEFRADDKLAEQVAKGAVDTFEWLTELGLEWEYSAPHPGYTAGPDRRDVHLNGWCLRVTNSSGTYDPIVG